MAANVSNYLAGSWLNLLRGTAFTAPSAVYVQLHTGSQGAAGTTNVSSVTTRPAATFSAASSGVLSLSNTPTWSAWGGSAETLTGISFWDSSTSGGGNFLWSAQFGSGVAMVSGATLTLTSSSLTLTLAS